MGAVLLVDFQSAQQTAVANPLAPRPAVGFQKRSMHSIECFPDDSL
jgi:hypothetical protein